MPKLVCVFSGWCEIDVADVTLICLTTDQEKTAAQWIADGRAIDDTLMLESFDKMHADATDGAFEELSLHVED